MNQREVKKESRMNLGVAKDDPKMNQGGVMEGSTSIVWCL